MAVMPIHLTVPAAVEPVVLEAQVHQLPVKVEMDWLIQSLEHPLIMPAAAAEAEELPAAVLVVVEMVGIHLDQMEQLIRAAVVEPLARRVVQAMSLW